jgi:hypothetical protein
VFSESDTLTFSRINRWKTAQLGWRGYAATDSITKFEKLKNKGPRRSSRSSTRCRAT